VKARAHDAGELHVGWHELHPDVSLNFQLNRWAAYRGPSWLADVRPVLSSLVGYEAWRSTFCELGERGEREGRTLAAGLHFRSAEFFMLAPTRARSRCDAASSPCCARLPASTRAR
jgi:hypothetical protein